MKKKRVPQSVIRGPTMFSTLSKPAKKKISSVYPDET